jgi:hypothetical protein
MELVILITGLILCIVGRLIARQLDCEPSMAHWLMKKATSHLPLEHRSRYSEEWEAHLMTCSDGLAKILLSSGYVYGARKLAKALRTKVTSM